MTLISTLKKSSNTFIFSFFSSLLFVLFGSTASIAQGNLCPEVLLVNEVSPSPIGYIIENEQGQIVASAPLGQLPPSCDLVVGQRYKLTPFRPGNDMDFVTTFDMICINRYLVGYQSNFITFSQDYASDLNQSSHVSLTDIILLRDFILHPFKVLTQIPTWRFFPKEVADANHVMPFNSENLYFTYTGPGQELEFKSIKMGRSRMESKYYDTNFPRVGTLFFNIADKELVKGKTYTIPFQSQDFTTIIGYQLALQLDPQGLELIEWLPGVHGHMSDVGLDQPIEGLVTTTHYRNWLAHPEEQSLPNGEVFFSIKVKARENGKLSQFLTINREAMLSEAYNRIDGFLEVDLQFKDPYIGLSEDIVNVDEPGFPFTEGPQADLRSLGSLVEGAAPVCLPNPFSHELQVGFWQAQAGETIIRICDLMGREVVAQQRYYDAGHQQWTWQPGNQLTPGHYIASVIQGKEVHTVQLLKH